MGIQVMAKGFLGKAKGNITTNARLFREFGRRMTSIAQDLDTNGDTMQQQEFQALVMSMNKELGEVSGNVPDNISSRMAPGIYSKRKDIILTADQMLNRFKAPPQGHSEAMRKATLADENSLGFQLDDLKNTQSAGLLKDISEPVGVGKVTDSSKLGRITATSSKGADTGKPRSGNSHIQAYGTNDTSLYDRMADHGYKKAHQKKIHSPSSGSIPSPSAESDDSGSDLQAIPLTLYGVGPKAEIIDCSVEPDSTYGDFCTALALQYSEYKVILLQAVYGPKPYWRESIPEDLIGPICQNMFAVALKGPQRYTLGIVQTATSDYPLAIFDSPHGPATTILKAVEAAQPSLVGIIKELTYYSTPGDVGSFEYQYEEARFLESSTFPTVFCIATDEVDRPFLTGKPNGSIPSSLQSPLVHCENLLQRVYDIEDCSLQVTHLLHAALHLINSIAMVVMPLLNADETTDIPGITLRYAEEIQRILSRIEIIVEWLAANPKSSVETLQDIENIFTALCGDLPGATIIRRSYSTFKKLEPHNLQDYDPPTGDHNQSDGYFGLASETASVGGTRDYGYSRSPSPEPVSGMPEHQLYKMHHRRIQSQPSGSTLSHHEESPVTRMHSQFSEGGLSIRSERAHAQLEKKFIAVAQGDTEPSFNLPISDMRTENDEPTIEIVHLDHTFGDLADNFLDRDNDAPIPDFWAKKVDRSRNGVTPSGVFWEWQDPSTRVVDMIMRKKKDGTKESICIEMVSKDGEYVVALVEKDEQEYGMPIELPRKHRQPASVHLQKVFPKFTVAQVLGLLDGDDVSEKLFDRRLFHPMTNPVYVKVHTATDDDLSQKGGPVRSVLGMEGAAMNPIRIFRKRGSKKGKGSEGLLVGDGMVDVSQWSRSSKD